MIQQLRGAQRFGQPDAAVDAVVHADLGDHRDLVADGFADPLGDLTDEPAAIVDTATVGVLAPVEFRTQKGAGQVEVAEVQFDRVEAGLHGDLGRFAELVDDPGDLIGGDSPAVLQA